MKSAVGFLLVITVCAVLATACGTPPITGPRVVYERHLDNHLFSMGSGDYYIEIYVARPDGSQQTRLTFASKDANGWPISSMQPSWSQDGAEILFVRGDEQNTGNWEENQIMVMKADGTQVRQLASGNFPSWSPDGTRIAYTFKGRLFVMRADGRDQKDLAAASWGIGRLSPEIAWSPDGMTIAFNAEPNTGCDNKPCQTEIRVISPDGTGEGVLAEGFGPVWSPDGRQFAFTREKNDPNDPNRLEIHVMNRDGSDQIRLAEGEKPAWSPDSKQLAFDSSNCQRGADLLLHCEGPFIDVINSDGTGRKRSMDGFGPKWLADGRIVSVPLFVGSSLCSWDLYQ